MKKDEISNLEGANENTNQTDDFEAEQNLLGFFKLLLEVDLRVSPWRYQKQKTEVAKNAEK